MRLHRFFGEFDLGQNQIIISDKEILYQLKNVLRLGKGDKLILCDGKSNEAIGQIVDLSKTSAEIKIEKTYKNENEPERHIILYCSVLKRENFELVAQKATEIGVKEIAPIITKRTVKLGLNYERLNKIIKEAAEQSGRGVLPVLRPAMDFNKAVKSAEQNDANLFFDASGKTQNVQNIKGGRIGVWIGPEGGWDEEELNLVKGNNKFTISSLGFLTLRAETAAIVASYLTAQTSSNSYHSYLKDDLQVKTSAKFM